VEQRRRGHVKPGSPIGAVARKPKHLDLFVTGSNELIYGTWWDTADPWADWRQVTDGTAPPGSPVSVVARNPDQLSLFATSRDGRVNSTSGP